MFTLQILDRGQTFLHPLDTDALTLGSGPEADLQLGEDDVLPVHVRLLPRQDGVRLTALAPVRVNGIDTTSAELALGDRIEVGRAVIVVGRSVARAAEPEDVLADFASRDRRQRSSKARASRWLPLVVAALVVGGVVVWALQGGDRGRVLSELATIARWRQTGQLERATAAIATLRAEWVLATDDRLQRLAAEQRAIASIEADAERLTTAVLDPAGTLGYAEWNIELQRLEGNGSPSEMVAARQVRSTLSETLRRRPKVMVAKAPKAEIANAPLQPTVEAPPPPPPAAAPTTPSAPVAYTAEAPSAAPRNPEATFAEADRLASQGLFTQAIAVLQGAGADAENAAAAAGVQHRIEALRTTAQRTMATVIDESARAISAGKPQEAVAMLTAARHRFPPTPEFVALAQALGQAEALVAAAVRKAATATMPTMVDESVRMATLASLRAQMESVRAAEERAAFAEAARLLRDAAALVRDRDADFGARLARRADEAELLAAWHDSVAAALQSGRELITTSTTGQALTLRGVEGPMFVVGSVDGEVRCTWHDIAPAGVHALAEQVAATGRAVLGVATLLYKQGDTNRAELWLAKALRADAGLKPAIDGVLARGRGEPSDPLGYTLGKEGFVSGRSLEVQKQAQKLGGRLAAALRDKNPTARQALVTEVLASGPDALAVMVAAFQKEFGQQIDKLQAGSLRKQVDRLAEQRAQLDRARQFAKDLIYDEVKYFYPYKPPAVSSDKYAEYIRVQAEVDRRVAAVRTLWMDERLRVRVPASLRTDLDRLDWVAKVLADLGELDPSSLARAEWARALPVGDSVAIRDYCATAAERAELEEWRRIDAYNTILGKQVSAAVREQLAITNDYRAMFRHRPLALVRSACDASQGHAEEMSRLGYFSHMSPTPGRKTPYDRMRLAGYMFGTSENIALVDSALGAHNAWCSSSGHHRNLLDPHHSEAGIGADGRYWVQNFGSGTVHRDDPAWAKAGEASR